MTRRNNCNENSARARELIDQNEKFFQKDFSCPVNFADEGLRHANETEFAPVI